MINAETGRVHTSYHQAVTATRAVCLRHRSNLQNIPIRNEEGRHPPSIRCCMVGRSSGRLLSN
ncbi:DNA polymerase [Vibrio lentus]|nr:DNA polymerase [Vibrio lentus]